MDVRMASRPGLGRVEGSGGRGRCSNDMAGKIGNSLMAPQIKLDISADPPVLDTGGCKPAVSRPSSRFYNSTRKVGAQVWTSLCNVYNSVVSGPPLTWVNPEMIHPDMHSSFVHQPLNPEPLYPMLNADCAEQPLWYQATPESQFGYEDPLQSFSFGFTDVAQFTTSHVLNSYPPAYSKQKFHKPLNPEAKEWVPNNYRYEKNTDLPITDQLASSGSGFQQSKVSPDAVDEFVEITQVEIEEIRQGLSDQKPKNPQEQISDESSKISNFDEKVAISKVVSCKENANNDPQTSKRMVECEATVLDKETTYQQQQGTLPVSYASMIRNSPEPPAPVKRKVIFETKRVSPVESVKQPLPKIFLKDKKYPKEKAPPLMETKKRENLPFKTASKTQKRSSKKFLKDLKEMSPSKCEISFTGSECSLDSSSPSSDVMDRLCVSASPVIIGLSTSEFLKENCGHSPQSVKSQRSMSESSASGSHVRSLSESTMGSRESIDIDFVDNCEILEDLESPCTGIDIVKSESASCKHVNSVLAHILGFDESESEESDNDDSCDDDDDWDTVQECVSVDDLDSWQSVGIMIPLITNLSPCPKSGRNEKVDLPEETCDNECSLDDINKRWQEEICKDIRIPSPSKVSFGRAQVHPMVSWSFAYKNARKGPWEQYARDRSRFQNRVQSLEPILSSVMLGPHRSKMYCKIYGEKN